MTGTPTLGGSSLALLFWWQSLTPTLIPRSWETQAVIGAVCLAVGYGIGTLAGQGVHRLLERWNRSSGDVFRRRGWIVLGVAWLIGVFLGAVLWMGGQNSGGFDRKVLVVWVPTGSGWMIPEAAAALEQLHRGDTAIVAMQYSFLPSLARRLLGRRAGERGGDRAL